MSFPSSFLAPVALSFPSHSPAPATSSTSPEKSDITLCFADKQINAHKEILAAHSSYFEAVFTSDYMDLESREVWLYDDDPNLVEAMLRRIYQMPLTDDLLSQYRGLVDIEIALHQVASKYDVPCLAEESKERIQAWFAMMVGHENRRALGFYVHKLYHELKGNQRQLRNIARDVCDEHFESLLECKDLDFKQLLLDLPELAHDMGVDVQRMQMKTRMAGGDSTEQKDGESDDGWGDSLTFL